MKILLFIEGFNDHSMYAQPWKHVHEIGKRMILLGHDVEIWTDGLKRPIMHEEIDEIPIRRLKKGRFFFHFEELLHAFNESNADIINWLSGPLSSIYFWRYRKSLRKPIIWTVYKGSISISELKNLSLKELALLSQFQGNISYSLMPRFLIRKGGNAPQVKFVITWTERLKNYLLKQGIPNEKFAVIPSGVDIEVFKQRDGTDKSTFKKNLGLESGSKIILYFGPSSTFRGVNIVLAVFEMLKEAYPKASLVLLFRDSDRNIHKDAIDLRYKEKYGNDIIIERGIQSSENLARFLSIADLVILPFKFWPHIECPLTVLEAMSVGRPVITTNVGSLPEFVQDNDTGIVVRPDAKAVSRAALELLASKELSEKIGKKASAYVHENYDWDIIVDKTLKIFRRGLNQQL